MLVRKTVAIVLCLGLFGGCTSTRRQKEVAPERMDLTELNELLHTASSAGRGPTKLADLEKHSKMFPKAYNAVKNGDIIVVWNTPVKGEGDVGKGETVIAYEKNVPTEGGYVLLSAGTVKQMSAADFAAAK